MAFNPNAYAFDPSGNNPFISNANGMAGAYGNNMFNTAGAGMQFGHGHGQAPVQQQPVPVQHRPGIGQLASNLGQYGNANLQAQQAAQQAQ